VYLYVQWFSSQIGLSGAGIVGVVETDFLDPIHNKQEFDKTDRYKYVISLTCLSKRCGTYDIMTEVYSECDAGN